MKKCSKCKEIKSRQEFHKSSKHSTGLKPDCKDCRLIERKKSYDRLKEELGYYVYTHSDSKTGEVFYVGSGCGRRAFDHHKRSFEWREIVDKMGDFRVNITQSNLSKRDSLDLEQKLQLELKPIANFRYAGKGLRWGKLNGKAQSVINCRGDIYETVTDAALEFRTSTTYISKACRTGRTCSRYLDGRPAKWKYYENPLDIVEEEVVYSVNEPAEV